MIFACFLPTKDKYLFCLRNYIANHFCYKIIRLWCSSENKISKKKNIFLTSHRITRIVTKNNIPLRISKIQFVYIHPCSEVFAHNLFAKTNLSKVLPPILKNIDFLNFFKKVIFLIVLEEIKFTFFAFVWDLSLLKLCALHAFSCLRAKLDTLHFY